jgi:methylated-DNA-protein-cysteine methyltransferase-like protein
MELESKTFTKNINVFVAQIPKGRVMTYGQLAALAGSPNSARIVGGIAHFGDPQLPWHRVVNKQGGLASGYPGGRNAHKVHLEAEGVVFSQSDGSYVVDVEKLIWWPELGSGEFVHGK